MSFKKSMILSLEINISNFKYDSKGLPVFPFEEEEDDDDEEYHPGYFNMHLLEDDVLD